MTGGRSAHPQVPHPHDLLADLRDQQAHVARWNDAMLSWLAEHVLASMVMFDVALIAPLAALPMPDGVKLTLGVISGSWFQWWSLPALQRQAMKGDAARAAKADADHVALTHIATEVDEMLAILRGQQPTQ